MKRRDFLKKSTLAFAGTTFYTPIFFTTKLKNTDLNGEPKKIIIVGAGLSGLIAGYELKKKGHDVTLLEARSTPGGRIQTIREPFADNLYAEAGASRIHQDHHLVLQYSKLFKLPVVSFYPPLQNDLIEVNGKSKCLKDVIATDYADYSPRFQHNIYERLNHPVFKIEGGMDRLPKAISEELKNNIQYGSPVVRLEQNAFGVKAYFERADKLHYVHGDRLICTLPFSVLKHIEFQPALSEEKSQAIFQMPYHSTCRILYQTRERFWEEKGLNGFAIYKRGEIWHPTFDQQGERGILAYYPAQYAVRNLSIGDRLDYGREAVERFFPGFNNHVEGHFPKYWDEDPYALGAVSMPEALDKLRPFAAKPEGRIHFAGEHLSASPRWMEGAIESGLRVTKEVNAAA